VDLPSEGAGYWQIFQFMTIDSLGKLFEFDPVRHFSLSYDLFGLSVHNWDALCAFSELESLVVTHHPRVKAPGSACEGANAIFLALSPSGPKHSRRLVKDSRLP